MRGIRRHHVDGHRLGRHPPKAHRVEHHARRHLLARAHVARIEPRRERLRRASLPEQLLADEGGADAKLAHAAREHRVKGHRTAEGVERGIGGRATLRAQQATEPSQRVGERHDVQRVAHTGHQPEPASHRERQRRPLRAHRVDAQPSVGHRNARAQGIEPAPLDQPASRIRGHDSGQVGQRVTTHVRNEGAEERGGREHPLLRDRVQVEPLEGAASTEREARRIRVHRSGERDRPRVAGEPFRRLQFERLGSPTRGERPVHVAAERQLGVALRDRRERELPEAQVELVLVGVVLGQRDSPAADRDGRVAITVGVHQRRLREAHVGPHRVEQQAPAEHATQAQEVGVEPLRRAQVELLDLEVEGVELRERREENIEFAAPDEPRLRTGHPVVREREPRLIHLPAVHWAAAGLERPRELPLPVVRERTGVEPAQQVEVGGGQHEVHVTEAEHRLARGEGHVAGDPRAVAARIEPGQHVVHRVEVALVVVHRHADLAATRFRNALVDPRKVREPGGIRVEGEVPAHRDPAAPPDLAAALRHGVRQAHPVEAHPDRVLVLAHEAARLGHDEGRVVLGDVEPAHHELLPDRVRMRHAQPAGPDLRPGPATRLHVALGVRPDLDVLPAQRILDRAVATHPRERIIRVPRLHQQHLAVVQRHRVDHHPVAEIPQLGRQPGLLDLGRREDLAPVPVGVAVLLDADERPGQLERPQHDLPVDQVAHVIGHVHRPASQEGRVELVADLDRVDRHVAQQRAADGADVELALHRPLELGHHQLAHPPAPDVGARHDVAREPGRAEQRAEREGGRDQHQSPKAHRGHPRTPARSRSTA